MLGIWEGQPCFTKKVQYRLSWKVGGFGENWKSSMMCVFVYEYDMRLLGNGNKEQEKKNLLRVKCRAWQWEVSVLVNRKHDPIRQRKAELLDKS